MGAPAGLDVLRQTYNSAPPTSKANGKTLFVPVPSVLGKRKRHHTEEKSNDEYPTRPPLAKRRFPRRPYCATLGSNTSTDTTISNNVPDNTTTTAPPSPHESDARPPKKKVTFTTTTRFPTQPPGKRHPRVPRLPPRKRGLPEPYSSESPSSSTDPSLSPPPSDQPCRHYAYLPRSIACHCSDHLRQKDAEILDLKLKIATAECDDEEMDLQHAAAESNARAQGESSHRVLCGRLDKLVKGERVGVGRGDACPVLGRVMGRFDELERENAALRGRVAELQERQVARDAEDLARLMFGGGGETGWGV